MAGEEAMAEEEAVAAAGRAVASSVASKVEEAVATAASSAASGICSAETKEVEAGEEGAAGTERHKITSKTLFKR